MWNLHATFVVVPKMKWKMRIWYLVLVATCGMGIPDAVVCARSARSNMRRESKQACCVGTGEVRGLLVWD